MEKIAFLNSSSAIGSCVSATFNPLDQPRFEPPRCDERRTFFQQVAMLLASPATGMALPGNEPAARNRMSYTLLHGHRDGRPLVHLDAGEELVAAVLRAEERG